MIARPVARLLDAVAVPATVLGTAIAGYLGVLTVAAMRGMRRGGVVEAAARSSRRFRILVPAHDEAAVITDTVRSLVRQRFPGDRFTVDVVTDNCSDATAELAAHAGATVHDRRAQDDPGKAPALNWLLDRIEPDDDDVVVFVDADSTVDAGFLEAMDRAFAEGAVVAQGFYGVKDPGASTSVALRSAALACRHHLRPLGRQALGGSCGLFGNGMALAAPVARAHRWSGHLTEDAELQIELLLDGLIVEYVPDARLAAEMPTSLAASETQHQRWELGRLQLVREQLPRVLRARSAVPLRRRIDAAADLVLPPTALIVALQAVAVLAAGAAAVLSPSRAHRRRSLLASGGLAVTMLHVLVALGATRAPRSVYRSLLRAPGLVGWKLALLVRTLMHRDDVVWVRTARNT